MSELRTELVAKAMPGMSATAGERNVAMDTSTTSSSTIKPMSAPGCCTVVWWV